DSWRSRSLELQHGVFFARSKYRFVCDGKIISAGKFRLHCSSPAWQAAALAQQIQARAHRMASLEQLEGADLRRANSAVRKTNPNPSIRVAAIVQDRTR